MSLQTINFDDFTPAQERLFSLLSEGAQNGIHATELSSLTGWSEREIRHIVESIRRAGIAICSSEKGYFLPSSIDEVRAFVLKAASTAKSIAMSSRSAAELLLELERE